MSFQTSHFDSGLGMPGSGFASRRGGNQVFNNRLSMAPPSNISTINESQPSTMGHTPRTSRSHMLAGLRTAPKSSTYPGPAPANQARSSPPIGQKPRQNTTPMPQTAYGGGFGNAQRGGMNGGQYGLPEILAPPELQFEQEIDQAGMDPQEYAALMHQGQKLAQQQALLQQQLLQLTMAQQQMHNLNLGGMNQQQQLLHAQMLGSGGFYNQQLQNGMQPVVSPVPGTPGLYSIFNPLTGQQKFMVNEQEQAEAQAQVQAQKEPVQITNSELSHSPPPTTPTFHAEVSPPPEERNVPVQTFRSPSPPKSRSPPMEVNPLPPPSATAFRRGHAKQLSSVTGGANAAEGIRVPRTASFPLTPQTGTFGPGQARAGDHPIRQPRGPPSLEELKDKPTSKHEGSKNFVTRQRRRALNSLVKAGVERRGASRGSNSIDSPTTGTPSSEVEITFSVSSDSDHESGRSSRGSIHGAIGSERKALKEHSRERKSTGTALTTKSLSSEEGIGKMVEIKIDEIKNEKPANPMLVLTSATEKRRSAIF